ncbi:MAG: 7-cyano-7-deazaguanine synthase QueC [Candidatus Zixiibacteriota bacterium]|nr:MAG: 7-cyano-7-deazaguanine synthase QueC [candidate division Zixibacteria bacterium]
MAKEKAVILLSGGIDSATTLAIAKVSGLECYALTFDYGQRHRVEVISAGKVAAAVGVAEHLEFPLALNSIGGSALTEEIEVPKDRSANDMASAIPATYVPARNTIFLSIALAWAEIKKAAKIYIGANNVDYSGYPDCRPEFIQAFQKMADLATRATVAGQPIRIQAPLIGMTKAEIILEGVELGVDYSLTHSCYDPSEDGLACGRCDSCSLRRKGFSEAGVPDPTRYRGSEQP